jgi:hypothetical protein
LSVRELDSILFDRSFHNSEVVTAHLIPEPSATGVDEHKYLAFLLDSKLIGNCGIEYLVHFFNLKEVVPAT